MTKRTADTFAGHESVPLGAVPFFAASAKRLRGRGGGECPPSPNGPFIQPQLNSVSSDEMSDASESAGVDLADAVSAHQLVSAPSCSSMSWHGGLLNLQPHVNHQKYHLTSLGVLTPPSCPEACSFLGQLATCMYTCPLSGSKGFDVKDVLASSIGTALWHAFAELNVLLARHFSELPTSMLRGYHSFTRTSRAQLWTRFAASQGAQLDDELSYGPSGWPCHMQLMRFLLEHALASYPTASCVLYTIEVPQWLRSWCGRLGHPGHSPLRVLALFAYDASGSPCPRALYIPCAE